MKMVEFFNRIVMMVTTSILAEENLYRRAKVIQKAIKVRL
jgi:RasGEF domain.